MNQLSDEEELDMLEKGEIIDPDLSTEPEKYKLPKELIIIIPLGIIMAIMYMLLLKLW